MQLKFLYILVPMSLLFILSSMLLLMPADAAADECSVYMKMECQPDSNSVSINVFYIWDESKENGTVGHQKNTYAIDAMSGKPITCILGNKDQIGIIPFISPLSNANNIYIYSENAGGDTLYLDYNTGFQYNVSVGPNGKYFSKYCSSDDKNFEPQIKKQFAPQFREHKKVCRFSEEGETEKATYTIE